MAANSGHIFSINDNLELYSVTKQPGDGCALDYDFTQYCKDGGFTVASIGAITISPTDGTNAPTASSATKDGASLIVSTNIAVGTPIWNTTGTGRLKFIVTFSNGEKREIDTQVSIVDL